MFSHNVAFYKEVPKLKFINLVLTKKNMVCVFSWSILVLNNEFINEFILKVSGMLYKIFNYLSHKDTNKYEV